MCLSACCQLDMGCLLLRNSAIVMKYFDYKYYSNSDAVLLHCCSSAIVVSTIQHVWCTAIPARSGSVMDVATHLAGV